MLVKNNYVKQVFGTNISPIKGQLIIDYLEVK